MAEEKDTNAQLAELGLTKEQAESLQPFSLPVMYASAFQLQGSGNDFNLILQRRLPAQNPDGSIHAEVGKLDAIACLTLSPQSAKDLSVLLAEQIARFEQQFGTIETPFLKQRSAKP